jgi:hypothetical protein
MEVYRRITERVRGALWAHHRRLMSERQFNRILAFVYNNKYEYQIRFDKMSVVGSEWGGRVEVLTTPGGFVKRVRVSPDFQDLPQAQRKQLLLSAYGRACAEGRKLMETAELQVYKQFLKDLKPVVLGIRDNPEFYTVADDTVESLHGTLSSPSGGPDKTQRTIPFRRAHQPSHAVAQRQQQLQQWLSRDEGKAWLLTAKGKEFAALYMPETRKPGQPGAKKSVKPLELLAPYTPMDEARLQQRNWMAFLENKHVAENMWTRAKIGDREKLQRRLQETGQAWHRPINSEAVERW